MDLTEFNLNSGISKNHYTSRNIFRKKPRAFRPVLID